MSARNLTSFARLFAGVCATTMLVSTALNAQETADASGSGQFVEEVGGSERINLSGKLRMLSQRIPAAACNLNADIAADESRAVLVSAIAEFDQILAALEFGDEALGVIGAEERRKTLRVIEEIHNRFDPLEVGLGDVTQDVPSDAAMQALADGNLDVLEVAKMLVFEISTEYANPAALLLADATAIDIAGRQRLLTQGVSKDICFIMSGLNVAESRAELDTSISIFEASLDALANGMEDVGVRPPPTEEIAAGLVDVNADWLAIKDQVSAVAAGETIADDARAVVFLGLNKTMADMNHVVGLYSQASKLGL